MSKRNLRHTKQWKEQRKEIIKGKVCAWCGSDKSLVVHHYNEPRVTGLNKWKSIFRSVEKSPKNKDLSYDELKQIVDEKFADWKKRTLETYMDFSPENIIILCKRCHYALHKGMVLCKNCKQKYHKRRYDFCYECNQKLTKEEKEKTLSPPLHSGFISKTLCGKTTPYTPAIDYCLHECKDYPCVHFNGGQEE